MKLLTIKDLAQQLARTRGGVYKLIAHDSTFPKPIKEGSDRRSRVYFLESEVNDWIAARVQDSRKVTGV